MMYQGRAPRRPVQVTRSQLAVRLGLAIYAILTAGAILRCAVLMLNFPATVATVRTILLATAPLALPLSFIPGADRVILGSATLSDVTAGLIILAAPLLVVGTRSAG
jgi:hypothetical protein